MGESIVYALKVALAVASFVAFMAAIGIIINLMSNAVAGSIVGEVFGLISVYLPFNAHTVFSLCVTAITGCLAFLVARKIYSLMTNTYQAT